MSSVKMITAETHLEGKKMGKYSFTPAAQFGSVGAVAAVQHANEPITCIKVGGFYFHQTHEFSSGNREFMVYMDHPKNGSLVYLGTEYGKPPANGSIVVVGPTEILNQKDRVIGYFTTETERFSHLRTAKRLIS